jgi:hypothetical protein
MVAYLDDWLILAPVIPVRDIVKTLQDIGLTLNREKSHLQPSGKLVYLGLGTDLPRQQIQPIPQCIHHLLELLAILPGASSQDARRITGYVTWLAWAMNWPMFAASHLLQKDSCWIRWLHRNGLLQYPRKLAPPLASVMVYADATPTTIGVYWPGPPARYLYKSYEDTKPIAYAEMAAALVALIHTADRCTSATTITLATDSSWTCHRGNHTTAHH